MYIKTIKTLLKYFDKVEKSELIYTNEKYIEAVKEFMDISLNIKDDKILSEIRNSFFKTIYELQKKNKVINKKEYLQGMITMSNIINNKRMHKRRKKRLLLSSFEK